MYMFKMYNSDKAGKSLILSDDGGTIPDCTAQGNAP